MGLDTGTQVALCIIAFAIVMLLLAIRAHLEDEL